jgi:hypothetical protein
MTAKFASLHGGLLARKGQAAPAMLPLPVVPEHGSFSYVDAPAPARDETCCGGAAVPASERQSTGVRSLDGANAHRPASHDAHHEVDADHRTHVSVRLNPEQLRRLKTAAAQLHVSQQKIVADGLERYLDKLAVEDLAGCRCLKAKG